MRNDAVKRRLAGYLEGSLGLLAASLIAMMAVTACNLGGPLILRVLIDSSIPAKDMAGMLRWALAYLGLVAVSGVITYLEMTLVIKLGLNIVTKIKKDVFSRLLTLPVSYFDEHPVGELMARTESDCEKVKDLFSNTGIFLAVSALYLAGMIGV